MYDWEDYYREPSEFEGLVEQMKESLRDSVKDEIETEIGFLRKQNKELQIYKEEVDGIKAEYKEKKRELESERQNLEREVHKKRMVDLLDDRKVILYKAHPKTVKLPKCDKCDKNRKVSFTSPITQKTIVEKCLCDDGRLEYAPSEFIRYEFTTRGRETYAWYKQYQDNGDGLVFDTSIQAKYIYSSDMKFNDLVRYNTFFKDIEDCQKYCDWLMKNEKKQ